MEISIQLNRNPILDIIRYLSAILVALFHWNSSSTTIADLNIPTLNSLVLSGSVGVPAFFIVSGYVIAKSAQRTRSSLNFAFLRAIRLCPLLLLSSLISSTFGYFFLGTISEPIPTILASSTLTFEVFDIEPFTTVLWTLVVEVKFYIFVALILLIKRDFFYNIRTVIVACYLLILSDLYNFSLFASLDASMNNYLDYFCLGIVLHMFNHPNATFTNALFLFGQILFFYYRSVIRDFYTGDLNWHTGILSFVCLSIMISPYLKFGSLLSSLSSILGLSSYGIYLMHTTLGAAVLNQFDLFFSSSPAMVLTLTITTFTLACIAINKFFEIPAQSFLKRILRINGYRMQ